MIAFDSGNSYLRRDTWVTPDYTMGTMTYDMNRDYVQISDQNRAMGVMFASGPNNRVMVFGEGTTFDNKSYADITGVTRANCMVVQRDQNANFSGNGTLVFVPQSLWNARVETSGWLFLQSGNAYCAVRPASGGYTAATAAQGVDLSMGNIWAPVIIQMGQASSYADFAAFRTSVIANALTFVSNTLNYTSEAGDVFTFYANSKTTPRVNGTTVNLNPAKTYDSPYLSMTHGTNLATVSYPGYQNLLLNFDPASISFIGVNASTGRYQSSSTATTNTISFTVPSGSNRKLVLIASWENGNQGISATWNGTQNFTAAVNSTSDRNAAILYLDAPTAGTGNIVVTFPVNTASRVGVLSLVGVAPGVAKTSTSSGRSGSLNLPVNGSFVAGVYTSNGSPTINGPFSTTLYNGDSDSCEGNAGYQVMLTGGNANYTWSVTNPVEDSHALAAFVPASAAPVMLSTSPADNATAVTIAANLVATFSEPVLKGTGTITIRRTSNNSTVESFNVATSPALTFSGQALTINPTANLDYQTEFYVVIDATAVIDTSGGNAFAGISSPTAWSFTTVVNPAPTIVSLTPTDNATNVAAGANLVATFSETVVAGTGNIELRQAGGALVESFNVANSPRLTFSGATLTINPTANLDYLTGYYVLIDATAVIDTSGGHAFAGISTTTAWNFTTVVNPAPTLVSLAPTDNANNVAVEQSLVATFSETVVAGTGTITLKRNSDNSTVEIFNVANSPRLTFSGATLTINATANLDYLTGYHVLIDATAVIDTTGGDAFAGIASPTAWSFTSAVLTYANWISDPTFGLALADRDPGDDPDSDGIDNGVESFFGTNPGASTQGLVAGSKSGNTLTFTHPQGTLASNLSARYRWSTDLATFQLGGESSGGTTVNFTTEANTPSPGFTRVTATATGTLPARLFVDVEVTVP